MTGLVQAFALAVLIFVLTTVVLVLTVVTKDNSGLMLADIIACEVLALVAVGTMATMLRRRSWS